MPTYFPPTQYLNITIEGNVRLTTREEQFVKFLNKLYILIQS